MECSWISCRNFRGHHSTASCNRHSSYDLFTLGSNLSTYPPPRKLAYRPLLAKLLVEGLLPPCTCRHGFSGGGVTAALYAVQVVLQEEFPTFPVGSPSQRPLKPPGAASRQVRQEYGHLSPEDFRSGRSAFLRHALQRPHLFQGFAEGAPVCPVGVIQGGRSVGRRTWWSGWQPIE